MIKWITEKKSIYSNMFLNIVTWYKLVKSVGSLFALYWSLCHNGFIMVVSNVKSSARKKMPQKTPTTTFTFCVNLNGWKRPKTILRLFAPITYCFKVENYVSSQWIIGVLRKWNIQLTANEITLLNFQPTFFFIESWENE